MLRVRQGPSMFGILADCTPSRGGLIHLGSDFHHQRAVPGSMMSAMASSVSATPKAMLA